MKKIVLPPLDEKEFPAEEIKLDAKPKLSKFWQWLFGFTKFLLGVCLLPFVYSVSLSFLSEFELIVFEAQKYFWAGVAIFLVIYLLIWEPAKVYSRGQKMLEWIFTFFRPLVRVAPYLLPIYTIVFFVLYSLLSLGFKSPDLLNYFMFLFGFSMVLHLVFSAKTLRGRKDDFLKGNYIFGFSFLYIINMGILAFSFSIIFDKFSFVNFSNQSYQVAANIFSAAFKQLFL